MRSIPGSWSELTDKVHEFFRGPQSEDIPSHANSILNDQAQQNPFARRPSVEEVPIPVASTIGKRGRSEIEVSSGRSSKSSRRSGSAKHLVPNYRQPPPPNSIPIAVPAYNPGADWKLEQTSTMGGPHRASGGVKPINTLFQPSQQSGRAVRSHRQPTQASSGYGAAMVRASKQPALEVSKSRGSNVATTPTFFDGSDPTSPPVKKRRVDPTPRSDTVDLTSDDEGSRNHTDWTKGQPMPSRNASRVAASQDSVPDLSDSSRLKRQGGGDAFGNNELYGADRQSLHWLPRPKGSRRNAARGPALMKGTGKRPEKTHDRQQVGTAQTPMDVDADNLAISSGDIAKEPADVHNQRDTGAMPSIDLLRGVKEAGEQHNKNKHKSGQGSADDLNRVNDVMASKGYSRPATTENRANPPATNRRCNPQQAQPAASLDQTFKRVPVEHIEDDDPPVQTGRSANTGTRAQSPLTRSRSGENSPDVLHGKCTMSSQDWKSASAKKLVPVISSYKAVAGRTEIGAHSSTSTSRFQPNDFTRLQPSNITKSVVNDDEDIWHLSAELVRDGDIPILSIASKAIVSDNHGLALRWDPGSKEFILINGQDFVTSPLNNRVISIGAPAVRTCWTGHDESKKVSMKGSQSETSSGTILIEFATMEGKWDCYNGLHESLDTLRTKVEDPHRLEGIFANMKKEQVEAHRLALKAVNRPQIPGRTSKHSGQVQGTEAQIVHGNSLSNPRRKKLVEGMRGATLPEDLVEQEQHSTAPSTGQHASETTSHYFRQEPTRRSTRLPNTTIQRREPSPDLMKWTTKHGLPKWAKPVVFPEQGTRRVTIDAEDLMHLDAGEFLNDNIVNYALRAIEENLPANQKHRFHFFNTFFYTSLTSKNGKRAFNYEAVAKWTKTVDLFTKEFVVVPINLDLHWFVVIIHNLTSLERKLLDSDDAEQSLEDAVDLDTDDGAQPVQSDGPQSKLEQMTPSDIAEPAVDEIMLDGLQPPEETMALDDDIKSNVKLKRGKKKKVIPPVRKYPVNQPRIVSLDSFGVKRTNEIRIIKDYIIAEAREKRQMDVTKENLQGINASGIPQQSNFYDCGVYLIGYIKEFTLEPDRFMDRILGREMAESDFAAFDTSALRDTVRDELLKYGNMCDRKYRDQKLAKRKAQKGETDKTPNKNTASNNNVGEMTTPAASQASRNSPAAPQSGKPQETPSAPKTPATSLTALPSSPGLPTSTTFPRASHNNHLRANDDDDDLELVVPHALRTSEASRICGRSSARPDAATAADADGEMLDKADTPDFKVGIGALRPATPRSRPAVSGHNSHLSPLSSLDKDISQPADQPALSIFDARVTAADGTVPKHETQAGHVIKEGDASEDKQNASVRDAQHDTGSDATDIKSEPEVMQRHHECLVISDVGDEGDVNPLAESAQPEHPDERTGIEDVVEIPDSQA